MGHSWAGGFKVTKPLIFFLLSTFAFAQEPNFLEYKAVKTGSSKYKSLNDIESHLKSNLGYVFDGLGNTHEWSHLVNGEARTHFKVNGGEVLYCLDNKVAVLKDLKDITIQDVDKVIPDRLRGVSSDVYLKGQNFRRKNSINLFNEWTAYIHGATYGIESRCNGWEFELQHAADFTVYCTYAVMLDTDKNNLSDIQTRRFLKWNTKRVIELQKLAKSNKVESYLKFVGEDEKLVDFMKTYLDVSSEERQFFTIQ